MPLTLLVEKSFDLKKSRYSSQMNKDITQMDIFAVQQSLIIEHKFWRTFGLSSQCFSQGVIKPQLKHLQ